MGCTTALRFPVRGSIVTRDAKGSPPGMINGVLATVDPPLEEMDGIIAADDVTVVSVGLCPVDVVEEGPPIMDPRSEAVTLVKGIVTGVESIEEKLEEDTERTRVIPPIPPPAVVAVGWVVIIVVVVVGGTVGCSIPPLTETEVMSGFSPPCRLTSSGV